ncbi:MAG: 50S ribosomal protein L32e [Methanosarcinales archaeon]|nr:50S ribosomal protein L32e [Methanosarcinales archaeon]
MKDAIIEEFTSLKGVGESKAKALYEAGYTSFEDLNKATVEELSEIKGITKALAGQILDDVSHFVDEVNAEEELEEEVEEEESEKESKENTDVIPTAELEMGPESKRLLNVRKRQKLKKPRFVQTDQHKKKKLKDTWRKPRGLHNKKRQYILGKGEIARVGYGSPVAVKGLHPSGFEEVLLSRAQDLDNVDPATQAVRIARTVGQRKRIDIVKKAQSLGLKILNLPYQEEVQ